MWNYIRFWEIVFSTFFSRNKDNARISSYVQKLYCRLQIYILPTLSSILAVIFLFEVSLQGCLLQTKFLLQDKYHKFFWIFSFDTLCLCLQEFVDLFCTNQTVHAIKAMKSSPLLGQFCGSEFWGFSLLKI